MQPKLCNAVSEVRGPCKVWNMPTLSRTMRHWGKRNLVDCGTITHGPEAYKGHKRTTSLTAYRGGLDAHTIDAPVSHVTGNQ